MTVKKQRKRGSLMFVLNFMYTFPHFVDSYKFPHFQTIWGEPSGAHMLTNRQQALGLIFRTKQKAHFHQTALTLEY